MQLIYDLIHFLLHINVYLAQIIQQYDAWIFLILFIIIFCETGLVITPFLPGDSLLFAAGSIFAAANYNINLLFITLVVAAFCGDNCNYWIGHFIGKRLFSKESRWFKQSHLDKTHKSYEKYGAKAIILARFIPIVRTFMPFVAGLGTMRYSLFLFFSLAAAIIWVGLILYISYWFGNIPIVQSNFSLVIMLIILISILPPIIEFIRVKSRAKK